MREILTHRQTGTTQGPNPQTFTLGPDHFVFGNEAGGRITSIKTAWESAVLRGYGVKVERMRGRLSGGNRASRLYFDEGWTIYDVSLLLGHADVKTTERYIGADQKKRLHELVAKRALTLVK